MYVCVCVLFFHNTLSIAKLSSSKHQQAYDMCCIDRSVQRELAPPEGLKKKKGDIMRSMWISTRGNTQQRYPMPETTFNIDLQTLWEDPMSTHLTNFWKHLSGDVEWFLFVANRDHPSTAHHASYQGSQAFPESKDRSQHANKLILNDWKNIYFLEFLAYLILVSLRWHHITRLLSSFGFSECLDIWLKLAHVL